MRSQCYGAKQVETYAVEEDGWLLNASEQLAEDHGSLVIEVAGRKQRIALAA